MMTHYLLSIYLPDGGLPPAEVLEPMMEKVNKLSAEAKAAGSWVFGAGLHPPETATALRPRDGEVLTTDGPYVEGREHVGGVVIIEAADLDEALEWARRYAEATSWAFEVRPMAQANTWG